ncbi:MAG: hypothetical protein WKF35_05695 [Ferruginibacter sp.]
MPTHFHLLIYAEEKSERSVSSNSIITKNVISEGIRLLLSSYAKAINKQEVRTGNLFQQKTKAKAIIPDNLIAGNLKESACDYGSDCFKYIHENPVKAGIVMQPEDWIFSSFNEYNSESSIPLCDRKLAKKLGVLHL